jgi:tetratricopeptide (TPR) repeat protein
MFGPNAVDVSVRENGGTPLSTGAIVRLYSRVGSYNRTATTQDGAIASFRDVIPGEYEIEVQAAGYRNATEHASVMGGGLRSTFYVYMLPESSPASGSEPLRPPVVTPKLQRQMEKALEKMRKQQYEDALEDLEKAEKMAPGNPDVHYLLGMAQSALGRQDVARAEFERALGLFPAHVRSLLALGELQLHAGEAKAAAQTLEKAFQANGADWRAHFLLARAYFESKEQTKAEGHAERAVELTKGKNAETRLLLGKIAAARGNRADAERIFKNLVQDFPKEPAAVAARSWLASLKAAQHKESVLPPPMEIAANLPLLSPAVPEMVLPWAPPDIDSVEYPFVSGVTCTLEDVLTRAQLRMKKQLENFEKFAATEHIAHVEVSSKGIPQAPREKDFSYMVILSHAKSGFTYLEESRDGGENLDRFPTSMATKGLVSLGVAVLDRNYEGDFTYRCDGLTKWRGEPAWEMRFEQKKNVRSRVFTWRNNRGSFAIPLRGRVWVSANTYDLLHLESDLREPVLPLELTRDHLTIDYGPVRFEHGNTALWLPWHADAYIELHGKRYHHAHTLTNYMLFSVDTSNKVAAPKETPEDQK